MLNFVVFGPASVGKSSCIGFMLRSRMTEREYDKAKADTIGSKQGPYNVYDNKFACLVDCGKLEGVDINKQNMGSSKRMHIAMLPICKEIAINLIDTPGYEHSATSPERNKGIAYGDIGIFMIEINKLMNLQPKNNLDYVRFFENQLGDLVTWLLNKDIDKLIIVISKMDIKGYDQSVYESAKDKLERIIEEQLSFISSDPELAAKRIPIVPIGIDFRNETDSNIVTKKGAMGWYEGQTLSDYMIDLVKAYDEPNTDINDKAFVQIREYFSNPDKSGPKVRGKIINGSLSINDTIKLAPVHFFSERPFAIGKVLSIRPADGRFKKEQLLSAHSGDVIGIGLSLERGTFSDYWKNWRDSQNTLKTLCIVNSSTNCSIGSLLRFSIDSALWEYCRDKEDQQIGLYWFGSTIMGTIVSCYDKGEKRYLIVNFKNEFALPRKNSNYLISEFILFSPKRIKERAVPCEYRPLEWLTSLDKMGMPDNIFVSYLGDAEKIDIFSLLKKILQGIECSITRVSETRIMISQFLSLSEILRIIRRATKRKKSNAKGEPNGEFDIKVKIRDVCV